MAQVDNSQTADLLGEPETSAPARDRFGRLLPGHTANTAGRPRKGQTLADRVRKADEAVARKALKARDKRLELLNTTGQRAFESWLAYNLGLPKQTYVIENVDSPLMALFADPEVRAAIVGGVPQLGAGQAEGAGGAERADAHINIEATYRVLPPQDAATADEGDIT